MARPAHLHGFLNIDKPLGITSTDVVRRVRRSALYCAIILLVEAIEELSGNKVSLCEAAEVARPDG